MCACVSVCGMCVCVHARVHVTDLYCMCACQGLTVLASTAGKPFLVLSRRSLLSKVPPNSEHPLTHCSQWDARGRLLKGEREGVELGIANCRIASNKESIIYAMVEMPPISFSLPPPSLLPLSTLLTQVEHIYMYVQLLLHGSLINTIMWSRRHCPSLTPSNSSSC